MTSTTKSPTRFRTSPQALKIGSRVRCAEDGVEGRLIGANVISVQIRWQDGEQVTWRRDSLTGRPIDILDGSADQSPSVVEATTAEPSEAMASPPVVTRETSTTPATEPLPLPAEPSVAEASGQPAATAMTATEQQAHAPAEAKESSLTTASEMPPASDGTVEDGSLSEQALVEQIPPEPTEQQPKESSAATKPARQRNPHHAAEGGKEKKLSAWDAAAKVLEETGQAMTCQEMITAMAAKGYWTWPGGQTPSATLYSAIVREITVRGASSRFRKTDPGKFSRNDAV